MNLSPATTRIARSILLVMVCVLMATPLLAAPTNNQQATASISGEVYMDGNVNRIREPQERGILSARIVLFNASGDYVTETTSDSDGYYIFDNLATATYQLQIAPPAGYIVSDNGSVDVTIGEVGAPLLISTSLRHGIFVPFISR